MVIFSRGFWDSTSCIMEMEQIVELAKDQCIMYVPVFMFRTIAEVYLAAHDMRGKAFADQVRIITPIC